MGITYLFGCPPNLPWWRLQYMSDAEIAAYNRSFMVEVEMRTEAAALKAEEIDALKSVSDEIRKLKK